LITPFASFVWISRQATFGVAEGTADRGSLIRFETKAAVILLSLEVVLICVEELKIMSVRSAVLEQFAQVAKEQGKSIDILSDEVILLDSGLDSLCFAIIVARLEDDLGVDPFSAADELQFPTTIGEFVALYEHASQ
jgi:hypothetical protein